mgnify:CR=1 FL=1
MYSYASMLCCGHHDARISIGLRALSSVSQTNFPHLDFSDPQSVATNISIFYFMQP